MKSLQELFNEYQTEHSFQLLGRTFVLSPGRSVYAQLRIKYNQLSQNAYNAFRSCEQDFQTIDDLIDGAMDALMYSIKPALDEAVRDFISIGIYDVDTDRLYRICNEWGIFEGFENAYKVFPAAAFKIRANLKYSDLQRSVKKETRPRWQITTIGGNCFDAWGNQMKANAMNAVEGAGVSIANAFEAAADEAEANNRLRKLLNNSEYRNRLREEVLNAAFNLHLVFNSCFPENSYISSEDVQAANALCNNAVSMVDSEAQKIDMIHRSFMYNPFDAAIYIRFMKSFTNVSCYADFIELAKYCGQNEVISFVVKLLTDYVRNNLGSTEADARRCRQNLINLISQIGMKPNSFPEAFDILNNQDQKLDQEYRTVKGVLLNTRAEADTVRNAINTHGDILEQVLDVRCRADLLNHLKRINDLEMDPNVKQVYINKYKQQLDSFDKRCRKARRYVYLQDHDGFPFDNGDKTDMIIHYVILGAATLFVLLLMLSGALETMLFYTLCDIGYIVYLFIIKVLLEKRQWMELTRNGEYSLEQVMSNEGVEAVKAEEESSKPLFCTKCGARLVSNAKFCVKCGSTVENVQNTKYRHTKINVLVYCVIGAMLLLTMIVGAVKVKNGHVLSKQYNANGISTYRCKSIMNEFAKHVTEKDSEEICKLMLPDDVAENTSSLVYANMDLNMTNYNLIFKSGWDDLFEEIEYNIEDPQFYQITEEQIQETENYYKRYFGCDVHITDGYVIKGKWTNTKGFHCDIIFPIVNIENEGLKISPVIWYTIYNIHIQWLSKSGNGPNIYNSYK